MSEQLKLQFPSPSNFKDLGKVLSNKEKFILYLAIFVFIGSIIFWGISYYLSSTNPIPDFGGEYTEGTMGRPLYVNPILSQTNEVDSMLSQLIFSSLVKYDQKGNVVMDLAENYDVTEDGTLYTFKIKKGIKWHDQQELTAKDVLFTVQLIQDPAYKSSLRGVLDGITPTLIDDQTISFKTKEPSASFLNKIVFGILPKHIFEQIPADKFLLSDFNLKPIGSGPFEFSTLRQDEQNNIISYQLLANQEYHGDKPYLEKINFNFYASENDLLEAYKRKEINGFGLFDYGKTSEFTSRKDTALHKMKMPRYFAVFFNQTKSKALANKDIRKAINLATDRQEIIEKISAGQYEASFSPIAKSIGGFESSDDLASKNLNIDEANKILDEAGWKMKDGIREKDGEKLEISLITTEWQALIQTAELLKSQWAKIGVGVNISSLMISDFQQNYIKTREYQAILFGQEYYGNDPDDLYNFWHSSNKKDPGNNVSLYENAEVDKLLEEARKEQNHEKRKDQYKEIEKKITGDFPAVFIYSSNYIYVANQRIKGIDNEVVIKPSMRFANAEKWYIKTKRVKKDNN